MGLSVVTPPTGQVVSTAEAKRQARVAHAEEDADIDEMIRAATAFCETFTRRQFLSATFRLTLDAFPGERHIELPRPPLAEIQSVTYYDTAGTLQTWSASNYIEVTDEEPGRLRLAYGASWPAYQGRPGGIAITYTAGYGAAKDVPPELRHAIKLLVAHYYENREAVGTATKEIELGLRNLLWSQREDLYR